MRTLSMNSGDRRDDLEELLSIFKVAKNSIVGQVSHPERISAQLRTGRKI